MIKINNPKYIFYILIFIIFIIARTNYLINENEIIDIEFKSIAIANCSFPFGIIKETILKDSFLPLYYLLIHPLAAYFDSTVLIKIFNSILSLINVYLIVKIGKKLLNPTLGYLLGFIFSINHFYLYYSNLIAPYCLDFLLFSILIITILDFIKKPNKKHLKFLTLANCALIIASNTGFLYVICELFLLYKLFENRKYTRKNIVKTAIFSFIAFLVPLIFLIVQYFFNSGLLIPNTFSGVGLNFNSLFLLINDYFSPYLSFDSPSIQTKSTLGMIYSFLLNPNLKNINSFKILITLFYGSILPLAIFGYFSFKACSKNKRLNFLFKISALNFLVILILMLYEKIETHPIFLIQFFITGLILLSYGICLIKDNFVKKLVIFCLFAIQFINPEINSFNLTINKHYPVVNIFNIFSREYSLGNAVIVMPHLGKYAKLYYDNLIFFDFDYSMLQKNNKQSILRNLCNKKTRSINKKNIKILISEYLEETQINSYITKYFIEEITKKDLMQEKIIFFIDKLNSKPISQTTIDKVARNTGYSTKFRKIYFTKNTSQQSDTKKLFDSIKSKTLYNLIDIAASNFYLEDLIQYKKIDDEYFKVEADSKSIQKALTSYNSDYIFVIFNTYR